MDFLASLGAAASSFVDEAPVFSGPSKSPGELRDEHYASLMLAMGRGFDAWQAGQVRDPDALQQAEAIMKEMTHMGEVDAVRVRQILDQKGLVDGRRRQMERTFQELQRKCNKTPDVFKDSACYEPGLLDQLSDAVSGFNCCGAPPGVQQVSRAGGVEDQQSPAQRRGVPPAAVGFPEAVALIKDGKPTRGEITNQDKLGLYGLYKQGTAGDAKGERPPFYQVEGRAKWDAWKGREGMPQEQAKQAYVNETMRLKEAYGIV